MPRKQIVVHMRENTNFSLEHVIELESFLSTRSGVLELDGHDFGVNDSNIFFIADELDDQVAVLASLIQEHLPDLNFVIGAKTEGEEADYKVLAGRGICEIAMQ